MNCRHIFLLASFSILLALVGCNDRSRGRGPTGDSAVTVDSSAGDASGDSSTADGSADSSVTDTGTPGACTITGEVSGSGVLTEGVTSGTSAQMGSCGGGSAPEEILVWSPPTSGFWTIDTIGSELDTLLYVREGTCDGEELACNDDAMGSASAVTVDLLAGSPVYIFVDGFSGPGGYVLNANPAAD